MKSKLNSGIVIGVFALISITGCTPKQDDGKLEIHSFFNLANAAVSLETAYIEGVESALVDYKDLAKNVHYENITSEKKETIKNFKKDSFYVNIGTLDEGLQREITSNNLTPALFGSLSVKEAQYSGETDQFIVNPDPIAEAKLIAETLPKNAYIIYSNEPVYEAMYSSFLTIYKQENIKGTSLLPPKSNAFKEIVSDILTTDFDVFLFLTSAYDSTNLLYALSATSSIKDVYLPSYAKRFITLPLNFGEASFDTYSYAFNYHLLLKSDVLPANNEDEYNERDYCYFLDGYSATHFILSNYEKNMANKQLINKLHTSYKSRNLSGAFRPFL